MKKVFVLVVTLIVMLFSGCNLIHLGEEQKSEKKYIQNKSDMIVRCFDEKDVEGLMNLFCQNDRLKSDLEEQIENAFNQYEGKSVSYEHFDAGTAGGMDNGVCIDKHIYPEIRDIVTDTNSSYEIVYGEYMIYAADEDEVGIVFITLVDSNEDIIAKIGWD